MKRIWITSMVMLFAYSEFALPEKKPERAKP